MNKTTIALLVTTGVLAATSSVYADQPSALSILLTCPVPNATQNALTNFGTYVAGSGTETIQNQNPADVNFKSVGALPAGVPQSLLSYLNQAVVYDSTTGQVTCNYVSTESQYPAISASYTVTNGLGATQVKATDSSITLSVPFGVK